MKLSAKAFEHSYAVIQQSKKHPFNAQMMRGTLSLDRFSYYIEQDSLYLTDFARCHAILASKAPSSHIRTFLHYADLAFVTEQEVVHQFFKDRYNFKATHHVSPATVSYTSYLLRTCALEPIEVGVAALLPCFWIYHDVGKYIALHSTQSNPFARWIEEYSSPEFEESVKEMIAIFDELSTFTTDATRKKMVDAFHKSACLEWHFWNDAYHKKQLEPIDALNLNLTSSLSDIGNLRNFSQ
jgi:thiaminase/transcriptional activator TenA